jgi:hypothetical protein
MPLEKQNISIPIDGGMDTKTDSKQLPTVKMASVQNGVYTAPGKVGKRFGSSSLSTTVYNSGPALASGGTLALAARGSELVQVNGKSVYSYDSNLSNWVWKGYAYPIKYETLPGVSGQSGSVTYSDLALNGNIALHLVATNSANANVFASVYDISTNSASVSDASLASAVTQPNGCMATQCLSMGAYLYGFYSERHGGNNGIYGYRVTAASPSTTSGPTTLVTDCVNPNGSASENGAFDSCVLGSNIFIAYTSGNNLKVIKLDSAMSVAASQTVVLSGAATNFRAVSICPDVSNSQVYVLVGYTDGTGEHFKYCILGTSSLSVTTSLTAFTYSSSVPSIVSVMQGSSCHFLIGIDGSFTSGGSIYGGNVTGGTINTQPTYCGANFYFASKPFTLTGNQAGTYINIAQTDPVNARVMTVEWPQNTTLRMAGTTCFGTFGGQRGSAQSSFVCPSNVNVSSNVAYMAAEKRLNVYTDFTTGLFVDGHASYNKSSVVLKQTFGDSNTCHIAASADKNLSLGSGLLLGYDGKKVFENGFLHSPEILQVLTTGDASGLPVGTYQYAAVYEYTDANGQIHRSAPSEFVSVTLGGTGFVNLKLRTYGVPSTIADKTRITVYRTAVNQTVLYQLNNTFKDNTLTLLNDTTQESVFTGNDKIQDTIIAQNPILYTAGGVLPNDAVSAPIALSQHKGRLVAITDQSSNIYYSKTHFSGEPIAFNAEEFFQTEEFGGPDTAVHSLDDKLVTFKADRLYVVYGDGPADTGKGQGFSDPQSIISPVGCPYPKSIIDIPNGLIFKSRNQGFWLMDRGLNVQYIGAEVEAYNSAGVTSAVKIDKTTQVRFTLDSGVVLYYDYYANKWSVASGITAAAACLWNGVYTWVDANGVVYQENSGFVDGSSAISLQLQTGWIHLAGLQGYQRIYRALLLGTYYSGHTLTVQVGYDYEDSWNETHTITPASVSADQPYQFEIYPTRQKCQAIRFKIYDTATGTPGQGYDLSGLELIIGKKQGAGKTPATKKVT